MVSHQMCLPYFSEEHHGQYNGHENHQTPHQLNQWHPQLDLFLIAWVCQMAWVFHVASSEQPGRVLRVSPPSAPFPCNQWFSPIPLASLLFVAQFGNGSLNLAKHGHVTSSQLLSHPLWTAIDVTLKIKIKIISGCFPSLFSN